MFQLYITVSINDETRLFLFLLKTKFWYELVFIVSCKMYFCHTKINIL